MYSVSMHLSSSIRSSSFLHSPVRISLRVQDVSTSLREELSSALGIPPLVAQILIARGLGSLTAARAFLQPTLREHLPNPERIKGAVEAADLILAAIEKKKLITVYTDFDVDGLSGGAQLYLYLRQLGARVNHYTPCRFTEGYGFVRPALDKLTAAGTELLLTVDCGTASVAEIAEARERGMDVVVFDHHAPGECAPPANVVVNPAQLGCPFQDFRVCAAGLIWLCLVVLRARARERWGEERVAELTPPKDFLDLAALGTLCDMVPLVSLNRLIALRGLELLSRSSRPGVVALREVARLPEGKPLNTGNVTFAIGPRMNAAGRLDHGKRVFELLTTTELGQARKVAKVLDRLNEKRRLIEEDVRQECISRITAEHGWEETPAFAVFDAAFHVGVIGIAAQRIVEQFQRPAAVMGLSEGLVKGRVVSVVKGSVRSSGGFHVAQALQKLAPILIGGGGHAEAGGFSVLPERVTQFSEAFVALAREHFCNVDASRERQVDAEAPLSQIDFSVAEAIGRLSPFGVGNPQPLIVSRNVEIESVTALTGNHVRFRVSQQEVVRNAVGWNLQSHPLIRKGNRVSIAYSPEINSYQGLSAVQLNVREIWKDEC